MTTFAASTNADAFSQLRSQAAASGVILGTLSDVAATALTVANILGGGASAESVPAGNVTHGTFGSVTTDVGTYVFPALAALGASSAFANFTVNHALSASAGLAADVYAVSALTPTVNGDTLVSIYAAPTPQASAFTGVVVTGVRVDAFSVAGLTSPGDPRGVSVKAINGTGATNAYGVIIEPPTGASNKYLIACNTAATFNVLDTGAITTASTVTASGLITGGASIDLTGAPGTAAASHVRVGGVTRTTIGANGAATALTANPLGYLDINVAGTIAQIPYYNRGA